MRSILISAAMLSAVAAAGPAAAQYGDHGQRHGYEQGYRHGGSSIQRQIDQMVDRIRRAEDRDRISRREASHLLRQADRIDRLHGRYRRNGISPREHRDLQARIDNLRHNFRWERADRDGRRG